VNLRLTQPQVELELRLSLAIFTQGLKVQIFKTKQKGKIYMGGKILKVTSSK
jgi:hypothetical protein